MKKSEREIRSGTAVEVRAAEDGDPIKVVGYAAIYSEATMIADVFEEVIAPGAFTEALARGDDTVFLVNHRDLPLARTASGTLRLSEDARGLRIETELDPSDPDVQRIVPKMRRGDLSKMSFAFRAVREEWDDSGEVPRRTISEVELFDVSIVTDPAYAGTEIGLRSLDAMRTVVMTTSAVSIVAHMRRKARLRGL